MKHLFAEIKLKITQKFNAKGLCNLTCGGLDHSTFALSLRIEINVRPFFLRLILRIDIQELKVIKNHFKNATHFQIIQTTPINAIC